MEIIIVVGSPEKWPLKIPGARVVSPRSYITDSEFAKLGEFKVFNLCNAFKYQNMGYYVSLLARARMHNPEPAVRTIMDFRSQNTLKRLSGEVSDMAGRLLSGFGADKFKLDVYFGRTPNLGYSRLARRLFSLFRAPMFRAVFVRGKKKWKLAKLEPLSSHCVGESERDFVSEVASEYVARRHRSYNPALRGSRYSMGILVDSDEVLSSSNQKALAKFSHAASKVGFSCEFISRDDFDRINEFDAIFIRATTNVNNYTYAFARAAEAGGIAVVDDCSSIIRCANKVFQAEQAAIRKIPTPKTVIIHKGNCNTLGDELGFPIVIKQPDSQFSQGVYKVDDNRALKRLLDKLMKKSDLLIAQEFVPTKFDWRIGIFDRKPIFACKYYMAKKHWQIVNKSKNNDEGGFETLRVSDVPKKVVDVALRMANLIGNGLYGVDVKETGGGDALFIEINDNPNIDADIEDKIAGAELYETIMKGFMDRVNKMRKLAPLSKKTEVKA